MYDEEIQVREIVLKQFEMVLEHNTLVTKINSVPLLPKMDVWTKFEEGRLRRSGVIDRKRKSYRRTDRQTDGPTDGIMFFLEVYKLLKTCHISKLLTDKIM